MSKNYTFCAVQGIEASFSEPDEGKKPSVFTKVKVIECEDNPSLVGTVVSEYRSLAGGAAQYTMEALRNLGWSCNDITELEGFGSVVARGGVYTDEYNGKVSQKCSIWPIRAKKVVSAKAKKSFAAQFKRAAASIKPVQVSDANRALERAALPDAPEVEDDPFAPVPGDPGVDQDDPFADF